MCVRTCEVSLAPHGGTEDLTETGNAERTCTNPNSLCYNSFTGHGQMLDVAGRLRLCCAFLTGSGTSLVPVCRNRSMQTNDGQSEWTENAGSMPTA
jgi:hypothetical protein